MCKKIPEGFVEAVASFYGSNGGDATNPVWLCALEWGGGYNAEKPAEPDFRRVSDISSIEPEEVKNWLAADWDGDGKGRSGGSAFHRTQVILLKAIISGTIEVGKADPYQWVDQYKFFSKGHYGLSLNAFPVSMPDRQTAARRWIEDKVLLMPETGEVMSFAEWTGISTFQDYLTWCVSLRRKVFSAFRRKHHPAVIYCGGKSESARFFDIWTDELDQDTEYGRFEFDGTVTKMEFQYRWLNNGPDVNPTLLAVGPFFGSKYGLSSYDDCLECGVKLHQLCNARFNDGGAWLQKERFMPFSS